MLMKVKGIFRSIAFVHTRIFALLAALPLLCSCSHHGPTEEHLEQVEKQAALVESFSKAEQTVYRIRPGDELRIDALRRKELSRSTRVDTFGNISYPYLGEVAVQGLSADELAERLRIQLVSNRYYNNPQLTVSVVASHDQFVYMLGEWTNAGRIPISGQIDLWDAIGKAGGRTYDAEMVNVVLVRSSLQPAAAVVLNLVGLFDPYDSAAVHPVPRFSLLPGDIVYAPATLIADAQRFFNRLFDIIRVPVAMESGIVLYPDVEDVIEGDTENSASDRNVIINVQPP
jgi:protein involved in polysaccharide export with SLBB domain